MQKLEINSNNINRAVKFLKQGGVVIHPTDTCYGLAADITNEKAVRRVAELKQMSLEKPMSILVSDLEMFVKYGELPLEAEKLAKKYLPGALTLIVKKTNNIPDFYAENTEFVGIRIPDNKFSLGLAKGLNYPITTTSANITGLPQAYTPKEIQGFFADEEVLFLDGGVLPYKKPSTILKIADGRIDLIRQGEIIVNL